MKVLLIEDSPTDAKIIMHMGPDLEWLHVERVQDSHGIGSCDLIISDLMLPDSQGVETIRQVSSGYPHLPLIAATAADDPELYARCLIAGADVVLNKDDLTPRVLLRTMQVCLQAHAVRPSSSGELAATKGYVLQAAELISSISKRIDQIEKLI